MSTLQKTTAGPVINTQILWSQSFKAFGHPLNLSLAFTPMPIEPPILLLTATYEEHTQYFMIAERGTSHCKFVVNPSPFNGTSFDITFSNWKYEGDGKATVHLSIVGVSGLVIEQVFNGNIQFPK